MDMERVKRHWVPDWVYKLLTEPKPYIPSQEEVVAWLNRDAERACELGLVSRHSPIFKQPLE